MLNLGAFKKTLQFLENKEIDNELPSVVPISREFAQISKPSVIVSHYSSKPTPTQTLHIKYQRIDGNKTYTADEPPIDESLENTRIDSHDDEKEPITIDFHYSDEDFDKYQIFRDDVNKSEFTELITSRIY